MHGLLLPKIAPCRNLSPLKTTLISSTTYHTRNETQHGLFEKRGVQTPVGLKGYTEVCHHMKSIVLGEDHTPFAFVAQHNVDPGNLRKGKTQDLTPGKHKERWKSGE